MGSIPASTIKVFQPRISTPASGHVTRFGGRFGEPGDYTDFGSVADKKPQLKMSGFFRRGDKTYVSSAYRHVVQTLADIIARNPNKSISILVAGVANGQEPLSLLSTLKTLGHLQDTDLSTLDFQARSDFKMATQLPRGPFGSMEPPQYAKDGFVKNAEGAWEVSPELQAFFTQTLDNPQKALWNTALQNGAKNLPRDHFDCISCNNLMLYLPDEATKVRTFAELIGALKPGGRLITDPDFVTQRLIAEAVGNTLQEIVPQSGIYEKRILQRKA